MHRGILAACAWIAIGCHSADEPPAAPDRPLAKALNVLLVTLDTTRADALGAYGQKRPTTPAIDALAERGALFEQAYAASPSTLPSHATILTGRLPFAHGVRSNAGYQLGPENLTLAELFAEHGYATAAEIAAPVIGRRSRLDQGFQSYRDLDSFDIARKVVQLSTRGQTRAIEVAERQADDITRRGIEFVRAFDVFVSFAVTSGPVRQCIAERI